MKRREEEVFVWMVDERRTDRSFSMTNREMGGGTCDVALRLYLSESRHVILILTKQKEHSLRL